MKYMDEEKKFYKWNKKQIFQASRTHLNFNKKKFWKLNKIKYEYHKMKWNSIKVSFIKYNTEYLFVYRDTILNAEKIQN